jgi:hypothetical protein
MTVSIDGTEYLPITAVAERLTTTETKILMLLKQKTLTGELVEGEWYVTTASVDGYRPSPQGQSAAKGCGGGCAACGQH